MSLCQKKHSVAICLYVKAIMSLCQKKHVFKPKELCLSFKNKTCLYVKTIHIRAFFFFKKTKNIPEKIFKYGKKLYFCRIKLLDIPK